VTQVVFGWRVDPDRGWRPWGHGAMALAPHNVHWGPIGNRSGVRTGPAGVLKAGL